MSDFNKYVGIPFEIGGRDLTAGLDCYGLVRSVLMQEKGVVLPKLEIFQYDKSTDKNLGSRLKAFMDSYDFPHELKQVVDTIQPFDILWLRSLHPIHYGIVISENKMLHVELGKDSVIESFCEGRWKNKVLGAYRHDSLR